MDEPSSTLSKKEFEALLRIIRVLKNKGMTIVYISHRLEELYQIGDTITVLRDGRHVYTGDISKVDQKELIRLMIGHNIIPFVKKISIADKQTILSLQNVSTALISDISMDIKKSEIRGIYGLVGSGRTEVLRAIYGVDKLHSGVIKYRGSSISFQNPYDAIKQGIGLLPENRKEQGLILPHAVWENVVLVSLSNFLSKGFLNYKRIYESAHSYIKKLSIKTPSHKTLVSSLSGGNQQKVIIAKWLIKDCKVLLVDEPTQGIDVGAKAEIYKILEDLAEKGKTIIIVSSELDELLAVSNSISVMYEGHLVKTFISNELNVDTIQTCALTGRVD
jgi:ABC-type sugar transport system ATPase subunit